MRILYVSHLHPPADAPLENLGGMQRVSMQLIEALSGREDVHVEPVVLHATWDEIAMQTARFLVEQLVSLPEKAKEFGADVVLFSSLVTASLAPLLRSRLDVPMVAISHGRDVTLPVAPYQWYLPKVFDSLDKVVSVSSATSRECQDRGLAADKAVVLPNGFRLADTGGCAPNGQSRVTLSRFVQAPVEGKVLLTVGRLVKRKGHLWFLKEVLPLLKTPVTWLVVGDGPESADLAAEVAALAHDHRVLLLGKVDEHLLEAAYCAADAFVMPNVPVAGDMEGFGVVMLEANAKGVPVIASDIEGIVDVVEHGVNGLLVPAYDARSFAARIEEVISGSAGFSRDQLVHYVRDRFGWDSITERYVRLLRDVAEESGARRI